MKLGFLVSAVLIFASTASALPTETLFVKKSMLEADPATYYTGYFKNPDTDKKSFGTMMVPMNEEVADALEALPMNRVIDCDARLHKASGQILVYSLQNCR